jgi:predicted dienelactone hydrolase
MVGMFILVGFSSADLRITAMLRLLSMLSLLLLLNACTLLVPLLAPAHLLAAPSLSQARLYPVGVQTINVFDDRRQRPLRLEVWYPAVAANDTTVFYTTHVGSRDYLQVGQAARDAPVLVPVGEGSNGFPLLVFSHGQPGERMQMALVAEHLAAQGLVVASIDHTGSIYSDVRLENYVTSLTDRPEDILFVLNHLPAYFRADTNTVGLMGFSYGGYSSINAAGAGLEVATLSDYCSRNGWFSWLPCLIQPLMNDLEAKRGAQMVQIEPRIKAVMVFAPYGGPLVSTTALAKLTTPLFVAGSSADETAIYGRDALSYFERAGSRPKFLLTLHGANHDVWKLCPDAVFANTEDARKCQPESWQPQEAQLLAKHFATAFFGRYLQGKTTLDQQLTPALAGANTIDQVTLQVER